AALGPQAWTDLRALLDNPDLRSTTLHALGIGCLPLNEVLPELRRGLKSGNVSEQVAAAHALGALGPVARPALDDLISLSQSDFQFPMQAAIAAIAKIGTPEDAYS